MFKKKNDNASTDLKEIKPAKKKNKKVTKRIIIGAVVVVVLALLIVPKMFAPEVLPVVKTQKAKIGDVEQVLSTSGFVESEETKIYYADVNARITEFNPVKGSNIHAGDTLVTYDIGDLENQYKQQELQSKASKADYAQALADSNENATKYHNSSTDVGVLEQQTDDQQSNVQHIQMSINDEANYLAGLNSEMAELQAQSTEWQAKLKEASDEERINKVNNKIENIDSKIDKIKEKIKNSNNYTTDLNNKLISSQNELASLQSDLSEQKSIKSSSETGVLSGNQKTQKAATTEVTALTLEQAQANLDKAKTGISAEFNGIITDVQAAQGATIAQGTNLFTVASNEDVKLTIALSKYDLENVKEGQSADITLGGSTYKGTVSKISKVATKNEAGAAVINAEIHIDNPDDNIYLGVEAKVKIKVGSASNVLLIPVECVNTDKDGSFCYVVDNGVVVKKSITTGLSSDEYMEVKEGINENDVVISEITTDIAEGIKVNAVSEEDATLTNTGDAANTDAAKEENNTTTENGSTDEKAESDSTPTQE